MPSFTRSEVRQPRAYLQIDGQNIPCALASVTKTLKRSSDEFEVTIIPDLTAGMGFDLDWWAGQDAIDGVAVVAVVYAGDTPKTLITGDADRIDILWDERLVEIGGRDKSAKLAETRQNKKYNNQTVADVVRDIASQTGLNPVVSGGDDQAGKTFDADNSLLVLGETNFETLSSLAEQYGYRWYVDGDDLHFEPADENSGTYEVIYRPPLPGQPMASNAVHLRTHRNLKASKTVNVTVSSWDTKTQTKNEATATAEGASGDSLDYKIENAPTLST
jgi:hypothetical protein